MPSRKPTIQLVTAQPWTQAFLNYISWSQYICYPSGVWEKDIIVQRGAAVISVYSSVLCCMQNPYDSVTDTEVCMVLFGHYGVLPARRMMYRVRQITVHSCKIIKYGLGATFETRLSEFGNRLIALSPGDSIRWVYQWLKKLYTIRHRNRHFPHWSDCFVDCTENVRWYD